MLSNDIRKRIVDSYLNGHSKKEISTIMNVKISTVYAVIAVYLKEDRVESRLKGGVRKKALHDVHVQL